MMIIGCDCHPSWQQICWVDTATGETGENKLEHSSGEAEKFYRGLSGAALIGMESTGNCQWFVEMAAAARHDLWIGDAAKIRACEVLLVEAAQNAVRYDPGFRNEYLHRCHNKAKGVAKVAAARKLAIRLYWMLRTN